MSKKLNIPKEFLIEEYINKKRPIAKVAKDLNCGKTTLRRYLKNYGISIRTQGETKHYSQAGKNNPFYGKKHTKKTKELISKTFIEKGITKGKNNPSFKYDISKEFLVEEYINKKKSLETIAKLFGCHLKTIQRKLKEYYIPRRSCNETKKEIFKGSKNPNWNNVPLVAADYSTGGGGGRVYFTATINPSDEMLITLEKDYVDLKNAENFRVDFYAKSAGTGLYDIYAGNVFFS